MRGPFSSASERLTSMVADLHHTPTLHWISIEWVASVRPEGTAPIDLSDKEQVCPQIRTASIRHEGLGFRA